MHTITRLSDSAPLRLGAAILFLTAAVILAWSTRFSFGQTVLDTRPNTGAVGDVTSDVAYIQELKLPPGLVREVDVLLATWGKPRSTNRNELLLLDHDGGVLHREVIAPGDLRDNSYYPIIPSRPIRLGAADTLYLALLSPDGTASNNITAWANFKREGSVIRKVRVKPGASGNLLELPTMGAPLQGSLVLRVQEVSMGALWAETLLGILLVAMGVVGAAGIFFHKRSIELACRLKGVLRRLHRASGMEALGAALTEEGLLVFDAKTIWLVIAFFAFFALLVASKVHYSSIEAWNSYIAPDAGSSPSTSIICGSPKLIRSDEWLVCTPPLLGSYASASARSTPLRLLADLSQPWHWGFHCLDLERGFAFLWNFWVLGAFLAVFILLQLLTRNNFNLSLAGSLFLFFSSYNRWWGICSELTVFAALLTSSLLFFYARKRVNIIIAFVFMGLFLKQFVLSLYPPWQVPLGYLMIFLFLGFSLGNVTFDSLRAQGRLKALLLVVAVFAGVSFALFWYMQNKEALMAMLGTVYPGRRFSVGGDIAAAQFFAGYYDIFYHENRMLIHNICESAGFILFFPFVMIAILAKMMVNRKVNFTLIFLCVYIAVVTLYAVVGVPRWLAACTLASFAPGPRALIGVGVASAILTVVFLADRRFFIETPWCREVALAFCFLSFIAFGFYFRTKFTDVLRGWEIVSAGCLLAIASHALMTGRAWLFWLVALPYVVIPSLGSNPIAAGLAPIYSKGLVQKVAAVASTDPKAKWLVYGGVHAPQLLKAAGADIFNGVRFPPDVKRMAIFDPARRYAEVWNRYAHAQYDFNNGSQPDFTLDYPDAITVRINPWDERMRRVGVAYFVVPAGHAEEMAAKGFKQFGDVPLNGYAIFKRQEE